MESGGRVVSRVIGVLTEIEDLKEMRKLAKGIFLSLATNPAHPPFTGFNQDF